MKQCNTKRRSSSAFSGQFFITHTTFRSRVRANQQGAASCIVRLLTVPSISCVSIQGPHSSRDVVYNDVSAVDRQGRTERC